MNFLVNIDVDDLGKAIRFYTEAFDLRVGRHFGHDAVELSGGQAPIYLLVKARGTQAAPSSPQVREYCRHWTPVHLDVVVPDMEAALKRAMDAGARLEQPVRDSPWGKLALLSDPFGHGFCLVQFQGNGYDEIATDESVI
jgi:predicted enzyme related to lactoylglutathione lyase